MHSKLHGICHFIGVASVHISVYASFDYAENKDYHVKS